MDDKIFLEPFVVAEPAPKIYYNTEKFKLFVWEYNQEDQDIPGTLVAFAVDKWSAMDQIVDAVYDMYPDRNGILLDWQSALEYYSYVTPYAGFNTLFRILLNTTPQIYHETPIGIFRYPGKIF